MQGGWSIRFSPSAVQEKYKIPRGEAAKFSEAIAILYQGIPEDAMPIPGVMKLYEYRRNGYLIGFQVIADRTARIVYFNFIES